MIAESSSDSPVEMVLNPRLLVAKGAESFGRAEVDESIEFFDRAERIDKTIRPYLWQRGISYYYADRFAEGSEQFRYDVRVNPLDVEEIVWDIACQLRLNPKGFPPPNMMSLPKGKSDRRKIMSTVYALFRGEADEEDLAMAGHGNGASVADEFYSLLYLALFREARGDMTKASYYMKAAVGTKYARKYRDYMITVAQVHCKLRGWS